MRRHWYVLLGIVPLRHLRRWWWVIPVVIIGREVVGAVMLTTVVPWLYAILAQLQATHR